MWRAIWGAQLRVVLQPVSIRCSVKTNNLWFLDCLFVCLPLVRALDRVIVPGNWRGAQAVAVRLVGFVPVAPELATIGEVPTHARMPFGAEGRVDIHAHVASILLRAVIVEEVRLLVDGIFPLP